MQSPVAQSASFTAPNSINNLDPKKQELLEARMLGLLPRSPSVTSTGSAPLDSLLLSVSANDVKKEARMNIHTSPSRPSGEGSTGASTQTMSADSNIEVRSIENAIPISQQSSVPDKENIDFAQASFGFPLPSKSESRLDTPAMEAASITDADSNDSTSSSSSSSGSLKKKRHESKDSMSIERFLIRTGSTHVQRTLSTASLLDRRDSVTPSSSQHGLHSPILQNKSPVRKINDFFAAKEEGLTVHPKRPRHHPHPLESTSCVLSETLTTSQSPLTNLSLHIEDTNKETVEQPLPIPQFSSSISSQLPVMTPCLSISASNLEEELQSLRQKLLAAEESLSTSVRQIAEQQAERESLKQDLSRLSQELHDQRASYDEMAREQSDREKGRLENVQQVLKDLLQRQAIQEGKLLREKVNRDSLRLARLDIQRHGTEFRECWVDGYAFTELTQRLTEIQVEREDIEKERKQLLITRRKTKDRTETGGVGIVSAGLPATKEDLRDDAPPFQNHSAPSHSLLNAQLFSVSTSEDLGGLLEKNVSAATAAVSPVYSTQEEIFKLRLLALKKEEGDLLLLQDKLARERDVHIREVKRLRDEDQSRFNTHPMLNGRYLLLNMLGKGGFSEVYRGFDLEEMREVACKLHQLNTQWSETRKANYTRHAIREYRIHKRLHHGNIVQLYDVFGIDNNTFCTVMAYIEGSDLDHYLKMNKLLGEREARSVIIQVFDALRYLNEIKPPVIHYDLKPANLLLHAGQIFMTDFGLSKEDMHADGTELTSPGAGTYWYLPPECFDLHSQNNRITSKVDVWSAGVIFYQLLYGRKPFGDSKSQQSILAEKTMLHAHRVEFPAKPIVSAEAKEFISLCLQSRKEQRPDVLTICEHAYLKYKSRGAADKM